MRARIRSRHPNGSCTSVRPFAKLKGVAHRGRAKVDVPLPENQPVTATNPVKLRAGLRPGQARGFSG